MLYKYRSLDNFKFVLDILVNQRFFATTYEDMNDPMEGAYTYDQNMPQEAIEAFKKHYKDIKFCSLSKIPDNPLMWAHYSNGARGIVIGVELKNGSDSRQVKYDGPSHLLANKETTKERAKRVLCYKNDFWGYEQEVRIFAEKSKYVPIKVKQVIFGEKADKTEKSILKKIISNLDYSIEVIEKGTSYDG